MWSVIKADISNIKPVTLHDEQGETCWAAFAIMTPTR